MKKSILLMFVIVTGLAVWQTEAAPVVIAGSALESPPPFWENCFWGMTATVERAFPFTTISGGPFYVEELQVAVFSGSRATFSIHLDNNGKPGQTVVGIFETAGITSVQQVVSIQAAEETILYSNTAYWLVGQTPQAQVNWNLADDVFGKAAYRVDQGNWVIFQYANVSAFSLLGSQVPEPATLSLLAIGIALLRKRK